jgi:hypothetical protein
VGLVVWEGVAIPVRVGVSIRDCELVGWLDHDGVGSVIESETVFEILFVIDFGAVIEWLWVPVCVAVSVPLV